MVIHTCIFNETQGWTNFFLGARKMGAQNQSANPIKTQRETLLPVPFYLNISCSFIVNVFPSKVFAMRLF